MRLHHLGLALLVVAIWGFNFVVIKVGLKEIPPLLFCAARFFFAAFPAVFFIRRPNLPLRMIAGFGLTMFSLQFALLFSGMYAGTSAGLASLLLQIQVFVTILLAVVFLAEQPSGWQIGGAVISFSGIGLVAANFGGDISFFGLILILLAAVAWGCGNLIFKKLGKIDMFALIIWGSLFAWPPLWHYRFCWKAAAGASKPYPILPGPLSVRSAMSYTRPPCWVMWPGAGC
ncbi:MAG: EamA family transporter [Methylomonas sp.]|uniref:EamA family transporter n=1 Tax=Methylomonas sp. TaxID=418 RepID=UPI0025F62FB9|nr:EamA family transporter [Methylomonas sp.]MCK9605420.1 EamA family transporter [Methylomonas sp.]